MSRRKQLHPKPVKDRGKDDIEQVCRSHNLPGHILHLQELSDDPELDYSVHSISTILQGSQFGPFSCTFLGRLDEDRPEDDGSSSVMEIPVFGNPDAKVCLTIETPAGRWLRLLRKTTDLQRSNVRLRMQDERTLWCEVLKNILPDEELVAILSEDDNDISPSSSLSSSSSLRPPISSPASSSVDISSSSIKLEAMDVVVHDLNPSSSCASSAAESALPALVPLTALNLASSAAAAAASLDFVRWENQSSPFCRRGRQRKTSAGLFETPGIEADCQRATFSLIHVCMYCGVKFSNPRTLQAHITNYCSKKPPEHRVILHPNPSFPFRSPSSEAAAVAAAAVATSLPSHHHTSTWFNISNERSEGRSLKRTFEEEDMTALLCKFEKEPEESIECEDNKSVEEKREMRSTQRRRSSDASKSSCSPGDQLCSSNETISPGGGGAFSCPHCLNSFESSALLAQHLIRIHSTASYSPESSPRMERRTSAVAGEHACSKCNIRFSSWNTYKAHREFYCQKRNCAVVRPAKSRPTPSPETTAANENALPVSPLFCGALPPPGMPMFSPGSVVFPSTIFPPPPCLQPIKDLYMPQSQAVFLSAAPFLGSSNVPPSMAFNVPMVLQPLAPIMPNEFLLRTGNYQTSDAGKSPAIMEQEEHAAIASTMKRMKFSSESGDEKPLDLSTRKKKEGSPIVKERSPYSNSPTSRQQALSDNERKSKDNPDYRRSVTPASVSDGVKVCTTRYLSDSVLPIPPPSSSLLSSPYAISNMLPASQDNPLSPLRTSDLALSPLMVAAPPPSVNRCVDCNIVFYKHENYVAHREHYCSGRLPKLQSAAGPAGFARRQSMMKSVGSDNRGLKSHIGGLSPSPCLKAEGMGPLFAVPGVTLVPPPPPPPEASATSIRPFGSCSPELVTAIGNGTLRYYCIPCKIRFSSLDTLKAHKKFYCPSKPTDDQAEDQSRLKNNADERNNCNGSSPVGRDPSEIVMSICSSCGNTFASAQLLKLHYCTGTLVHNPLFHCPYCDYIAQSDSRLVDHIKAHAPSKAYKCVLCGYRGNTVRGMRMHGKMHNDAGETFTDDSMIEYEEPAMIPKRLRPAGGDGTLGETDVDLLRLKNEPYKRRRSRKAYEKSEFCHGAAPTRCVECKEMFSDADVFQTHMQIHVADKMRAWKSCDLNPNSTADLLRLQAKLYPGSVKYLNETSVEKFNNDVDHNEESHVKDSAAYSPHDLESVTNTETSDSASREEQEAVDVVDMSSGKTEEKENKAMADSEMTHQQTNSNSTEDSNDSNLITPRIGIKEEVVDVELDSSETDAKGQPDPGVGVDDATLPTLQSNGTTERKPSFEQNGKNSGSVEKYCEQCNIIFMYTSTFVAHKKYYCSSHREKEEDVSDQQQQQQQFPKHRNAISYLHP